MKIFRYAVIALGAALLPAGSYALQTPQTGGTQTPAPHSKKAAAITPAPSSQEIADAKAKGMVWVNTSTHVYHKDGSAYGNTKHGKFMTEDDAKKAGYRAAKEPGSAAKTSTAATSTKK